MHFNSHAHVERDLNSPLYHFTTLISTHTLTWSVTSAANNTNRVKQAFQLTRSRGAWRKDDTVRIAGENFNSHAHVERDDVDNYVRKLIDNFNSHAHVERDQSVQLV